MEIIWNISVPIDSTTLSLAIMANRIWSTAVNCGLPPDKIIISKIGFGNVLYDFLKDYSLSVELGE